MSVQSISLQVPKVKKRRWGKPKPGESLKMLAAGSLAFAKAYSSVEKLEHELEAEIQRDKENDPNRGTGIQKWRRRGGKLLLNKYVLLVIVVLNIIDCALVLGELILDLHHVKDILFESQQSSASFLEQLQLQYPSEFSSHRASHIEHVYDKILEAWLVWRHGANGSFTGAGGGGNNNTQFIGRNNSTRYHSGNMVFQDQRNQSGSLATWHTVKDVEDESVLKLVGFIFHKISLSISVILVLWVLMKIVCFGSHLLHRRLEVFDTFVILTSFVVDMIFVKGLSMYTLKQFVYILAFMLPWRVIRVTNSLVVAVKDHEHFRLKMLFTQKKKIEHDNKQIRAERDSYKEQVEALKKLCLSEGIDDWKIFQSLARQQIRPGSKGVMGSFASLAFGAFGNKSTSFWSVLDTPKMRRGKSMEVVAQNRINNSETNVQNQKRHSKAKILGFLGSSADYLRGKIRNGHHLSLDSDPGPLKANTSLHQNGHIGKRLVRGETIDTVSTESNDDLTERQCSTDDYPKQSTIESSVFGGSLSPSLIVNEGSMQMFRTQSDSATARPPLCHSSCLQETSCSIEHPVEQQPKRRASVGAMDSLTVTYRADYCRSSSDDVFRNETSEV
ncbi:uncharacterized protein LOC128231081 [Mya arenaria]|uniref:uncharacterized protein LOC128231081 n=1 Tax=Mya arenaria TaxID=6604 RepID=UPI0022E086BF|nr:uncharacterized protein LOC128231081 [Mya arenaria]